eukprot:c17035_g2_i2.p1 GENE.c17035_g2_i2~~c17035_g2_i2.p1  ORF type:complete len:111 (+),score=0.66 c17035_g2_i2:146-478(+)
MCVFSSAGHPIQDAAFLYSGRLITGQLFWCHSSVANTTYISLVHATSFQVVRLHAKYNSNGFFFAGDSSTRDRLVVMDTIETKSLCSCSSFSIFHLLFQRRIDTNIVLQR